MPRVRALLSAALFALAPLGAQPPHRLHEVIKLSDTLFEFRTKEAGYICKVLASIGPDGVLLVETDDRAHMPALLDGIKKLGGGFPRVVINSHSHQEHWDGNVALGKGPIYIGHENLRRALTSGPFLFKEVPENALPQVLIKDELRVHFNGEEIRIKAFIGAHDASDLVIWFTRSKVAFVGALATALKIPTVDGRGGDIRRYPEITRKVLDWLPQDVKLIPGHGEDATHTMGLQFLQMLTQAEASVKAALAQGKDLEAMKQEDLLKEWSGWETTYSTRFTWLTSLYEALSGQVDARKAKLTIYEPLHAALKEKGPAGITPAYAALKAQGDRYLLDDRALLGILFVLNDAKRDPETMAFGELYLREFPKAPYANNVRLALGEIHLRRGEKAQAAAFAKAMIEANPKSTKGADLLVRSEGK